MERGLARREACLGEIGMTFPVLRRATVIHSILWSRPSSGQPRNTFAFFTCPVHRDGRSAG
jgi:hypothetical protein